jgi:Ser/Thr protein kinase RdoA (MazF antagonist)
VTVPKSVDKAKPLRENLSSHPAAIAWARAGGGREPIELRVLRDRKPHRRIRNNPPIYWLRGAGPDGGAVIAKLGRRSRADIEHAVYQDVLPRLPVPGIRCLGRVEEGAELSWLFIEYADGDPYSSAIAQDRETAGRWLGALHASASALSDTMSLPEREIDQFADRARSAWAAFRAQVELPSISPDARAVLEAAISELSRLEEWWGNLEEMCQEQPRTLVHGDFAPKNLRLGARLRGPQLFAFDWEEAGWGSPAIDLAEAPDPRHRFAANPCLESYRQAAAEHAAAPEPDALRRLSEAGRVLRCLSGMYWLSMEFDSGGRTLAVANSDLLPKLRSYLGWLTDVICAMGWGRRAWGPAIGMSLAPPGKRAPDPAGGADSSLEETLAVVEPGARVVAMSRLKRDGRVRRARLVGGRRSSVVVKRARRAVARKTSLLNSRWLPAVGLQDCGPPLLGSGSAARESVWQVFEDLGNCELLPDHPEAGGLEAATRLVARVHVAFADPSLLPGCRDAFGDLGASFYGDWLRGAALALQATETSSLSPDRLALLDRLNRRVEGLLAEEAGRTQRLLEVGGPATLLHGDLWPQNVLLPQARVGRHARLIDWDHAVVGPVIYDVSTFISCLSPRFRIPALRLYERVVGPVGWRISDLAALNEAFKTAEFARLACTLTPLVEAVSSGGEWAYEDLDEVDRWFAALASAPDAIATR